MAFEILISNNAGTQDTINLIIQTINQHQHSNFVKELTRILQPEPSIQFLKKVFDTVCHYVKYQRDPDGHERIKTPKRLFVDAFKGIEGGDCKKMSVAIASILRAAGIEPILKVISYDGISWEHIYVIAQVNNTWVTIDPVNDCKFNSEIPHQKAVVYNLNGTSMNLSYLGGQNNGVKHVLYSGVAGVADQIDNVSSTLMGCGCGCSTAPNDYRADAMGLKNSYFEYTAGEAAAHIAKVGVFALPRNAFLGLLYLGKLLANTPLKLNITSRIAKAWVSNPAKVRKQWWLLGGTADASALRTAVIKGSGIQLSGQPVQYMLYGKGHDYPWDVVTAWNQSKGLGMGEPVTMATVGAAIAAATPVIAAMKSLLNTMGVTKPGETDNPVPPDTTPPAPPPPAPPQGQGSVTGLALALMADQLPLYLFIPILIYTMYHTRSVWMNHLKRFFA